LRRSGSWIAHSGERRRSRKQHKRSTETEPGWEKRFHNVYGTFERAATAKGLKYNIEQLSKL
jgi:hypothetical protein